MIPAGNKQIGPILADPAKILANLLLFEGVISISGLGIRFMAVFQRNFTQTAGPDKNHE
jgi:hypothetical protein